MEPIKRDTRYMGQFWTTANTKIPPCGAGSVQPNSMESAPATAEPTTQDGMTRSGSGSGKGDNAFCDEREAHNIVGNGCLALFFGKAVFKERSAQGQRASGGTIPPIITAAITPEETGSPAALMREAVPKYISRFVERPAHVDAHHAARPIAPRMTPLVAFKLARALLIHRFSADTGGLMINWMMTPIARMPTTG